MKLVRKDDHSVEITGTLEQIPGQAWIADAYEAPDGSIQIDYAGGTDVWWDGQKTERDHKGLRIFVDENGDTVGENDIELINDNEED